MKSLKKNIATLFVASVLFASCASDNASISEMPEENRKIVEIKEEAEMVVQAGSYDNTLLAVDGKEVTGIYNLNSNSANCYFYFQGHFDKRKETFPIRWNHPGEKEEGKGTLTIQNGEIILKLQGKAKGQCPAELLKEGIKIPLTKESNWQSIRMVKNKSTQIYEEPEKGMETGASFKKDDIVCVLEKKDSWLRVEKIGQKTQAGWIKASDTN